MGHGTNAVKIPVSYTHLDVYKRQEIALVSIVHKITNLITSMDFIQSDAVSDTVKAAKYRIFLSLIHI